MLSEKLPQTTFPANSKSYHFWSIYTDFDMILKLPRRDIW